MQQAEIPLDQIKDRIQLPFNFDAAKMRKEIEDLKLNNFVYYDAIPLRAPAHHVDTSLPPPPPADDYADGSWTDWMDTPTLSKMPYFKSIMDFFAENTKVNLVRILRLSAGDIVKEHTNPTLGIHIERSMIRLTIPIMGTENEEFYLNNSLVDMKPGECWYLRLTDPHRVINSGQESRINLTIDMIPNEWITNEIIKAQNI